VAGGGHTGAAAVSFENKYIFLIENVQLFAQASCLK
jgi:hypothetical protein